MHKRPGTRNTSSAAVLTPRTKTCLSICKHSGIVALETAFDQLLCAGTVDGLLLRVHVKHKVIGEGLVFPQDHLRLSRHHIRTDVTSLNLLPGQLRTNPAENPETVIRLCQVSLFLCTIVLKVLYDSGKMLLSVNTKRKKKSHQKCERDALHRHTNSDPNRPGFFQHHVSPGLQVTVI